VRDHIVIEYYKLLATSTGTHTDGILEVSRERLKLVCSIKNVLRYWPQQHFLMLKQT